MKYIAWIGIIVGLILVRATCVSRASSGYGPALGASFLNVNKAKVDIEHRRIRYSEAKDRYIDFGYDYDAKRIVVYIPSADRWAREKPDWAKARRDEIVGEVKRTCSAKMDPKPIYEEY